MGIRLSRSSARNNGTSRRPADYDEDELDMCIRGLRHSRRPRSSNHEPRAMKKLVGVLEGFVPMDDIADRDFTISDCCLRSLLKGTASEARLAYRAIGLLALTVGARIEEYLFNVMFGVALAVARNTMRESSDTATVAAALHCLAAVSFAGARRPEDTHDSMKAVMAVFNPRLASPEIDDETDQRWSMSPELLDAAVSTWTLLLSTIVGFNTFPYEWKEATSPPYHLAKLLQSDDLAVRTAAGMVLAMWAERILTQHASPKNLQELDDRVSNHPANTKRDQCPDPEETTSTMPNSFGGRGAIKVATWARLVQLSFLKRFLGKGFDKHVLHNPLVREVATVTDHEADELGGGATDGDVHQWHYRGKVVGNIKSWVQWVRKITWL